jgi:hypothetical protein
MAQTEDEVVGLDILRPKELWEEAEVGDGEEEVEREEGDGESNGDAGQNKSHPLVSFPLSLLPARVQGQPAVSLEENQNLRGEGCVGSIGQLGVMVKQLDYLGVDHGQHDDGEEILAAEDQDGECVLHVGMRPVLHADGIAQVLQIVRLFIFFHYYVLFLPGRPE